MDNIEEFFHLYAFEKAKNAFGNNCRGNGKIASLVRERKKKSFFHISILRENWIRFFGSSLEKAGRLSFISTKWKWIEAQKCQRKDLIPTTFWHQTSQSLTITTISKVYASSFRVNSE